jgi:diguanylate cyclase (GGDEF)-like protein
MQLSLKSATNIFAVVVILILFLSLLWIDFTRYGDFKDSHLAISKRIVTEIKIEIERTIENKNRLIKLFSEENRELITNLYKEPEKITLNTTFRRRLKRYFPDLFATAIATEIGKPIVDDFGGNVGKMCVADMQSFARDHYYNVRIHPNKTAYHFDVMNTWNFLDKKVIFFISFLPDKISRLLQTGQAANHKLVLVQPDKQYLIEIDEMGSRDKIIGRIDFHLSAEEQKRILYSQPIDGSKWLLVDIHDENLFTDFRSEMVKELAVIFSLFIFATLIMWRLILREETRRTAAENELRKYVSHTEVLNKELEQANKKLSEMSVIDEVTGIFNRRYFNQHVTTEWNTALRHKTPLSILLMDIDHFKKYNDTYGHQAGDECLKAVASEMKSFLRRSSDFVARFGGEEFIAITLGLDEDNAFSIADKLRGTIEILRIPNKGSGVSEYVTVSCGIVTVIPSKEQSIREVIKLADDALYEAKANGRNQVVQKKNISRY